MLASEAVFLGDTSQAEWLAWKTGTEDVMRGDFRRRNRVDVAFGFFAKIDLVGNLRVFIPI